MIVRIFWEKKGEFTMKSNWVSWTEADSTQSYCKELIEAINKQIEWYEKNSSYAEDSYIRANLQSIKNFIEAIPNSSDIIFIKKIVDTFFDIMNTKQKVVNQLEKELKSIKAQCELAASADPNGTSTHESHDDGILNETELQNKFVTYMLNQGKSTYTANDYCSRIRNTWDIFDKACEGYCEESARLPEELVTSVDTATFLPNSPLLNAYYHIEELSYYINKRIDNDSGNRNLINARSALNTFAKALCGGTHEKATPTKSESSNRDFSKFIFQGKTYGKSRLVLAVVQEFVKNNPLVTLAELKTVFYDQLQGSSFGVVRSVNEVPAKYKGEGGNVKRYFVNPNEIIDLKDGNRAIVSTQWSANIEKFIKHVTEELGYEIEKS